MQACKAFQEQLILYHYDELNDEERTRLETHIAECEGCRANLASLRSLDMTIPRDNAPQTDPEMVHALRQAVSRNIRRQNNGSRKQSMDGLLDFLYPAPALRIALAAALFVLGFMVGNRNNDAPVTIPPPTFSLNDLMTASNQIRTENGAIDPSMAGVKKIGFDPETGKVEVHYTTVNDVFVQDNLENPNITRLLQQAILEEDNPGVRLHAVKTVAHMADSEQGIASEIVDALIVLLGREENTGVRIKVLRLMGELLPNELVKSLLTNILLRDPDPVIRREALAALMNSEADASDIHIYKKVAKKDTSESLRISAERVVSELAKKPIPGSTGEENQRSRRSERSNRRESR